MTAALLESSQRTNALLEQIAALLAGGVAKADPGKSSVGKPLPNFPTPVATPSKQELIRQWFEQHPGDLERPGRELEQEARPQGVKISYRTWNEVRKQIRG